MKRVLVIGVGPGDPDQITVAAIKALNRVDVFFVPDKGSEKAELASLRRRLCERFIERAGYRIVELADPVRDERIASYAERVADWHERRAALWEQLLAGELGDGQTAGFLVWGDPSLYDSTLRILARVAERGVVAFEHEVIAGISSVQALAARHRICLHEIGEPLYITTGRRLAQQRALPEDGGVVVMLDGEQAWKTLDDDPAIEIFWGAYLGSEHELLISGPLRERSAEIARVRAAARAEHGWILDTYLLRRQRSR